MITFARVMNPKTGELTQHEGDAAIDVARDRQDRVIWLDIQAPSDQDLALLKHAFDIHALTLEDICNAHQRPKLEQYEGYIQLVLYEFTETSGRDIPEARELTILAGADFVISVHRPATPLCLEVAKHWKLVPELADEMATYLTYLLVDAAVDTYFPVYEASTERLADLEDAVLAHPNEEVLAEIFQLKKRLYQVRRLITPLRDVFMVLMRGPGSYFGTKTYVYFQDVLDHLLRVGDAIDLQRDILGSTVDLYMSSLSNRTNDTMKKLTVLSTILMTGALIAGIYGMNFKVMPELNWLRGYYGALWAMASSSWALTAIFRWRRYIGTTPQGAHPLGTLLLVLGGLVCCGWGAYLWSPGAQAPVITRPKYFALAPGMGLTTVAAVVGSSGEETTREDDAKGSKQVYTWTNPDGSSVTATFENGKLTTKAFDRLH